MVSQTTKLDTKYLKNNGTPVNFFNFKDNLSNTFFCGFCYGFVNDLLSKKCLLITQTSRIASNESNSNKQNQCIEKNIININIFLLKKIY